MLRGTTASVVACNKHEHKKININTQIKNKDLGELDNNQEQTIRDAIVNKNPEAKSVTFDVANITKTDADIIGTGDYEGTLKVSFTTKQDIHVDIQATALGLLDNENPDTIKQAIFDKNPNAKQDTFDVTQITISHAELKGTGHYSGTEEVTYTVKKEIHNFITTTELDPIELSEESMIRTAIIAKNPDAKLAKFTIKDITRNSATVVGTEDFYGQVNISFHAAKGNVSDLSKAMQKFLNQEDKQLHTLAEVQTQMKIIAPDADDVTITVKVEDQSIGAIGFEFNANKSQHYFDDMVLYQVINKNVNSKTICIDPLTNKIVEVPSGSALPANVTTIINIGWEETTKQAINHLPQTVTHLPDYISPNILNISYLLSGLGDVGDICDWDTTHIVNMANLFENNLTFDSDISNWNTANVASMGNMFKGASAFNQDISQWNTSNVTDMNNMFNGASVFNQDLSKWNTSKLTNLDLMFHQATNFNGNISTWNTSRVTTMNRVFNSAAAFNQDVSKWNTTNVTIMSSMFDGASAFNQDLSKWDTSKVTDMSYMFHQATNFNGNITTWNTQSVTSMQHMFDEASVFNQDLSKWNTSKITNLDFMFHKAANFNGNISTWDTSQVTTMDRIFNGATAFNQDISKWNTTNVTIMSCVFDGAGAFDQDLSKWDTSKVTDMNYMFHLATNFNGNITTWNTQNVTTMNSMFSGTTKFNQDISKWNTAKVTQMDEMFKDNQVFAQDLSKWNVDAVTSHQNFTNNSNWPKEKQPHFKL
ncbi:hypothetical protein ELUCI_v1c04420 [Williamsoniiplasma lucivorax]|uniref:Lipoprotein n=1 Tax=Williamsoniiplasma lucivorax TaxID=209274 RepID=A0A2S5RFS7_9MOLU|nr:hypothetical protein ELUCI_v1c04420 [Williamsoniiplasma lucivorax]